ncbi:hypothetical protein D7V93_31880 [Corallococcus llansteffanensis]|uniref:RCC1 repeat-containing protein n=1 Tax=Corallococcus llansteffanensis TaxID=2316731 RepID=A0A3A8PAG7_9BACT|nr:hypothetical protein D7V93_31880 [Corallococcus llansteffanensis]
MTSQVFTLSSHPCPVPRVDAAGDSSLILRGDGTVWGWGENLSGRLGQQPNGRPLTPVPVAGMTGATALAAGEEHSLALRADGTVWAWGSNQNGQLGDGTAVLVPATVAFP